MLIGLLFFGSVGVNVFAHFCEADGTSISFVAPVEHECAPAVEPAPCCHAEKPIGKMSCDPRDGAAEKSCCSDQMWNYKIPSDFQSNNTVTEQQQVEAIVPAEIVVEHLVVNENITQVEERFYEAPPPKSGMDILILKQVFRL